MMDEEIGKWMMDISKYIITAVPMTALLGMMNDTAMMLMIAGIVAAATLMAGLRLLKLSERTKTQKRKK